MAPYAVREQSVTRCAVFQLFQYISDSGGVLGLWFGFAIMTFIEFFEFFVDLTVLTVNKIRNIF